ncbi:hypothetical protein J4050_14065 [Winogradskyella sp. DF17]|jgi:uncharacterized protein YqgV (UPF0045/DUF77 family)|uniref:Thiamine-binding protein domain-containing protein n=1 Tax=Winogradskyella pelagia TaxID=2819984 RepID=A0ABS3T551_9FLAO|nr:hypothetical protein [Winogradskyella sp. DF17]MBO3117877.1 hypothetical protein [Winogradskyella sp. DF17]
MDVSIELTYSPLTDSYEQHVIDFIKVLRASKFTVIENPLSTQIFGNYDDLMPFLTTAIKDAFNSIDIAVMSIKLVKTDRSNYEPHF